MKKLFLIGLLFLLGCYEHIPDGVRAQTASEDYLDSLYRPNKVEDKIGVNFITLKEYLYPSNQKAFQQDNIDYHLSRNEWDDFKKKLNHTLLKGGRIKGIIQVENYQVNGTKYTAVLFVDSAFKTAFASIQPK